MASRVSSSSPGDEDKHSICTISKDTHMSGTHSGEDNTQ